MAKLSPSQPALRGRVGALVYRQTPTGTAVYAFQTPRNPNTIGQQLARQRMQTANNAYAALSRVERLQWDDYALRQHSKTSTGQGMFLALTLKFLHVSPLLTPPNLPPPTPFQGETAHITVTPGTLSVTFTASTALRPGSRAELLLQLVRSPASATPERKYRTLAFAEFTEGALSVTVPTQTPWWHAAAVRFVCAATGEQTGLIELEPVRVEGPPPLPSAGNRPPR